MTAPGGPMTLPPLPEQPLVSVLVTLFNYESYIGECVRSALASTYGRLEVVVFDDASTDGGPDIVREIARGDDRVRLLVSPENVGKVVATSEGFSATSGSIICLLDADDAFEPEKIGDVVQAFRASPRAGVALHPLVMVGADGSTSLGKYPVLTPIPTGWIRDRALAAGGLMAGVPPTSGISIRREVAHRIFPLSRRRGAQDNEIMAKSAMITEFTALPATLGRYRVHTSNASGIGNQDEGVARFAIKKDSELRDEVATWVADLPGGAGLKVAPWTETLDYWQWALALALARGERIHAWKASRSAAHSAEFANLPFTRQWFLRLSPFLPQWGFRAMVGPGRFGRLVAALGSRLRGPL